MLKQITRKRFLDAASPLFFSAVVMFVAGSVSLGHASVDANAIEQKDVVSLNHNLKNVIEENQQLSLERENLLAEIGRLKEDTRTYQERNSDLSQSVDSVRNSNRQYSEKISQLENEKRDLLAMKNEYQELKSNMGSDVVEKSNDRFRPQDDVFLLAQATPEDVKTHENQTMDILSKIDAFAEQDERLKLDAAKAHYNMGNIYFQKGEYEVAAREYYQAVVLMPDDPDVHYNLAFVSGEYLKDYKTALKHYQMYLYLSPQAKDMHLVKEKILHAKLNLDSRVDSPLEEIGK